MTTRNSVDPFQLCRNKDALKAHIEQRLARHKIRNHFYKDPKGAAPAAVLIPLFFKAGKAHILFTKRSENLEQHRGQISFPGGRSDPHDNTPKETALRETMEEVGIKAEDIILLGQTDTFLTNSDYLVKPFAGLFPHPYPYTINKSEIDRLIEAPLEHFLTDDHFRTEYRKHNGQRWTLHFYDYRQDTIWGVTGFLLSNFLSIVFDINRG